MAWIREKWKSRLRGCIMLATWHPDDLVEGKTYTFYFTDTEGRACKERGKFLYMAGRPLHLWFRINDFGSLPIEVGSISRVEKSHVI